MRYCPMCNLRTLVAVELFQMFYVETCDCCGHIHKITEKLTPLRAPACLVVRGWPSWEKSNV